MKPTKGQPVTTGELIKLLADYCPDTPVKVAGGSLVAYDISPGYDYDNMEPDTLVLFEEE